jgi:NADH dehydrogenase/NADH:ubiquinone oxidoreductase subunit G
VKRKGFEKNIQHEQVIYEPGKCIKCGLCIRITKKAAEKLGLTFVGRGFDVHVEVPFGESLSQGLEKTAGECIAACPTGALSWRDRNRK